MDKTLAALAQEIEGALELTDDMKSRATDALRARVEGLSDGMDFDATDDVLAIVRLALPGWMIQIKGTATDPNGHWHCSLRRSDVRDNDPYVGIGHGLTLPNALLAAVLGAIAQS